MTPPFLLFDQIIVRLSRFTFLSPAPESSLATPVSIICLSLYHIFSPRPPLDRLTVALGAGGSDGSPASG